MLVKIGESENRVFDMSLFESEIKLRYFTSRINSNTMIQFVLEISLDENTYKLPILQTKILNANFKSLTPEHAEKSLTSLNEFIFFVLSVDESNSNDIIMIRENVEFLRELIYKNMSINKSFSEFLKDKCNLLDSASKLKYFIKQYQSSGTITPENIDILNIVSYNRYNRFNL